MCLHVTLSYVSQVFLTTPLAILIYRQYRIAQDEPPKDIGGKIQKPKITLSDLPKKDIYEGGWDLAYDHKYKANGRSYLGLYIGEGSDNKGETRGVDLLVRFPGKPTRTPRIALLRIHPKSGILMIESLQKYCEVQYMLDNEAVILEVGKVHCFWQTTNLFAVGGLKFILRYPRLSKRELEDIRKERDEVWSLRGLPPPDRRFPIVPPHNPLKRLDDGTVVSSNIAGGAFGIVGIGLNIKTGEPCAVKSVPMRSAGVWKEFMNEGDILFRYPVSILLSSCCSGLMLRSGKSWNAPGFTSCLRSRQLLSRRTNRRRQGCI